MDFTINIYKKLICTLKEDDYTFLPFKEYIQTNHTIRQSTFANYVEYLSSKLVR